MEVFKTEMVNGVLVEYFPNSKIVHKETFQDGSSKTYWRNWDGSTGVRDVTEPNGVRHSYACCYYPKSVLGKRVFTHYPYSHFVFYNADGSVYKTVQKGQPSGGASDLSPDFGQS